MTKKIVHEVSAGGIIIHHFKHVDYFLVLLYHSGYWDFPKGHQEAGETLEQTAIREIYEETSLAEITLDKDKTALVEYQFSRINEDVHKKVIFYAAKTITSNRFPLLTISFEHRGYAWVTFDEAMAMLPYQTARNALQTIYGTLPK